MASNLLLQTVSVNDVIEKVSKRNIQVLPIFRTRLIVRNAVVLSKLASNILVNLDIVNQIDLVAKHDDL